MGFIVTISLVVMMGVVLAFAMFIMYRDQKDEREAPLRRKERQELRSARVTLDVIDRLAYEYRLIDGSDLTYKISDLIQKHEKEFKK